MITAVGSEPLVRDVRVTKSEIIAYLADGRVISVPLAWSWRLSDATPAQRAKFRLIGAGQGIHWPEVDEDISVEGMLHGSPAPRAPVPRQQAGLVRRKPPTAKKAAAPPVQRTAGGGGRRGSDIGALSGDAMPPDHSSRLRNVYARFAAGDAGPMFAFLSDDVVYHLPGRHLGGGTLRGRAELLRRMAEAAAGCDAPPRIELLRVLGTDDFVVSCERFVAVRRGRTLDQEVCVVWRVAGDRCVEIWSHFVDQEDCDAFWRDRP